VKAALNEADGHEVGAKLAPITDDLKLAVVFGPNFREGITEFTVTPVSDVAGFAKRIDFATVLAVDAAQRTVTVAAPAGSPGKPAGTPAASGSGKQK